MPLTNTIKMTAEQFLMLGEDPPGTKLELVDGEIIVSPSPTPKHSFAATQLIMILGPYIEENDLGELHYDVDTILDPFNVRRPDILFFANDRLHLIGEKSMEGPPTLAVEVVSPGSVEVDREVKFKQYRKAGVPFYWIVDPMQRVFEAFELKNRRYVSAGRWQGNAVATAAPFSELEISLSRLWRRKR